MKKFLVVIKQFLFLCCVVTCCFMGVKTFAENKGHANVAGVEGAWKADVKLRLSDLEPSNKYLKKLQICNMPSDYLVEKVFVCCGRKNQHFLPGRMISSDEIVFNEAENCYEICFNLVFCIGDQNKKSVTAEELSQNNVYVDVHYRKKSSQDEDNNKCENCFSAKISNEGLKTSKVFPKFAGMRVERFERNGKRYVKFVGVPEKINVLTIRSIGSLGCFKDDSDQKKREETPFLNSVIIHRNDADEFLVEVNEPFKNEECCVMFMMKDVEDYEYDFWLNFEY